MSRFIIRIIGVIIWLIGVFNLLIILTLHDPPGRYGEGGHRLGS